MHGSQINLLQAAITKAGEWRGQAATANIVLSQINLVFPDGKPVTLFWDETQNDWLVDT